MSSRRPRQRIGRLVDVAVDGFAGPVHVREDGPPKAPTLVLIHGFSGSMHWYGRVVPLLADRFRLIRVDLLGHGATGGGPADAPLQARVVQAVLEALDVTGAVAVGHSFGADVAVTLAETSDRVDALVLVTQAPDYSAANIPRAGVVMTVPLLAGVLYGTARGLAVVLGPVLVATRGRAGGRDLAAQGLRDFRSLDIGMFPVILIERRVRLQQRPLDAQVLDAGKPTMAILGSRDHFYGDRAAPRYRAAGARVEILSNSGHSPLVELPGRTADLLRDFASEVFSRSR
ncbi:MAG: alpha/beta hydrolase [Jatrophihabitans sp.]